MTFNEALGMAWVKHAQICMAALDRIDAQTWSDTEKEFQKRMTFEQAAREWLHGGFATAKRLVELNQNSRHDFSHELRNGVREMQTK